MNIQSVVASLLAIIVLIAVVLTSGDPKKFLDLHAILIVVGGTTAAGAVSFQIDRIVLMFRIFFRQVIQRQKEDYVALISELMVIAEAYRTQPGRVDALVQKSNDPFLREAMTALLEEALDQERLVKVLQARADTIFQRQTEDKETARSRTPKPISGPVPSWAGSHPIVPASTSRIPWRRPSTSNMSYSSRAPIPSPSG